MNTLAGYGIGNVQIPGHVRLSMYVAPHLLHSCNSSCQVLSVARTAHSCGSCETRSRFGTKANAGKHTAGPVTATQSSCCSSRHCSSRSCTLRSSMVCCAAHANRTSSSPTAILQIQEHQSSQPAGSSSAGISSNRSRRSSSSSSTGSTPGSPSSQLGANLLQQLRAQRINSSTSNDNNENDGSGRASTASKETTVAAAAAIDDDATVHAQPTTTTITTTSSSSLNSTGRRQRQAKLQHLSITSTEPPPPQQQQQQEPSPEQQQQQQQQQSAGVLDPSALPIMDRVRLIRNRVAARQPRPGRGRPIGDRSHAYRPRHCNMGELGLHVLSACSAAGIGSTASSLVLDHVVNSRIGTNALSTFLKSYMKLQLQYGQETVLHWLRRCPPIFRLEDEVADRLQQLGRLLGGAPLAEVLALTRRCPVVLGVKPELLEQRLGILCKLLQRPSTDGAPILQAAPALLAMDPNTLAVKVKRLQLLAALHPKWAQAYSQTPSKNRAVLLTYSLKRQMRLVYLAQTGQHGTSFSISTVMAWSEDKMQEMYPAYAAWYAQHAAAAAAAEEAARAAAGTSSSSCSGGDVGAVAAAAAVPQLVMPARPLRPMPH